MNAHMWGVGAQAQCCPRHIACVHARLKPHKTIQSVVSERWRSMQGVDGCGYTAVRPGGLLRSVQWYEPQKPCWENRSTAAASLHVRHGCLCWCSWCNGQMPCTQAATANKACTRSTNGSHIVQRYMAMLFSHHCPI